MTDTLLLDTLLADLAAATTPVLRATVVAELTFSRLDGITALIARRCVVLHWFDLAVIAALSTDQPSRPTAAEILDRLAGLPFVERVTHGFAYHQETKAGLLAHLAHTNPTLLRYAALLAESVFLHYPEPTVGLPEAVYCRAASGDDEQTLALLTEAVERLVFKHAWAAVVAAYSHADAARECFGVQPLTLTWLHYTNLGNARSALGDFTGAIADYDRAIALNPDFAMAYCNRGLARSANGDLMDAFADFDRSLALNPNDAKTYFSRGNVLGDLGALKMAIADYDQALALQPDDADTYIGRGNARRMLGDLSGAIADYEHANVLQPGNAGAYSNRGAVLRLLGQLEEAMQAYRHALELQSNSTAAWLALADIHRRRGETSSWQAALAQVRTLLAPDDLYNTACFTSIAGEVDHACDLLAQALAEQPGLVVVARQDPDLAWLQADQRFQTLIDGAPRQADPAP